MLFAVCFGCKTRTKIIYKLELYKEMLDSKGFILSQTKTEYITINLIINGREVKNQEPL